MEQTVLVLLVGLLVLAASSLLVRALPRASRRGVFDCSWRSVGPGHPDDGGPGGGRWARGVARVGADAVSWWRAPALGQRPRATWRRSTLEVLSHRDAGPTEVPGMLAGALVVRCAHHGPGGQSFELAMTPDAYTGFASWLESAPPRDRGGVT